MDGDPASVGNVGEAHSISLDCFPAMTDHADLRIFGVRTELLTDKTSFTGSSANSPLTISTNLDTTPIPSWLHEDRRTRSPVRTRGRGFVVGARRDALARVPC